MKRVFYHNITYHCNNDCVFCISKSVKNKSKQTISVADFMVMADKYKVTNSDVWNINGGEPTLSDEFNEIIEFCNSISTHIIVYSNGRNLSKIPQHIIDKIERIIVPIYGTEDVHNRFVCNCNAYKETLYSISKIIALNPNKIDIKLLLDGTNNIENLFKSEDWNNLKDNRHFSVSRILNGYHDNTVCPQQIVNRAENIIFDFIMQKKTVRFYDLPFCLFSSRFKHMLQSIFIETNGYSKDIITGYGNNHYRTTNYSTPTNIMEQCVFCRDKLFCTQIMKNYFCPVIDNGVCTIQTE